MKTFDLERNTWWASNRLDAKPTDASTEFVRLHNARKIQLDAHTNTIWAVIYRWTLGIVMHTECDYLQGDFPRSHLSAHTIRYSCALRTFARICPHMHLLLLSMRTVLACPACHCEMPAYLLFVLESIDVNVRKKCSKCKWNRWFQIKHFLRNYVFWMMSFSSYELQLNTSPVMTCLCTVISHL